jgi:glucose-1-phosphate thymidylyltransferase
MKGVVLSGGFGTRLRPLTHTGPKQLIPIANKPMLFYAIEDLRDAGVRDIAVILGTIAPEKVREAVGDGSSLGVRVEYIVQGEPKGIAHAVKRARKFVGDEPFVVYLGDNILKGGIKEFVRKFKNSKNDATILLCRHKTPERFGVAEVKNGKIVRLVEKPKQPKSNLVMIGIYFFRKAIFDAIEQLKPSWRGEYEITEAVDCLVKNGYKVGYDIVKGWWKDTGKPEDIIEANHLVLEELNSKNEGEVEEGANIRGRVSIGEGTVVRKGCFIKGPVIIGKKCEVDSGTYIGPYTSVGDECVLRGVEIESSIVMNGSRIECKGRIVDSLIGANNRIVSGSGEVPKAIRLVVGENSYLSI